MLEEFISTLENNILLTESLQQEFIYYYIKSQRKLILTLFPLQTVVFS